MPRKKKQDSEKLLNEMLPSKTKLKKTNETQEYQLFLDLV